MGRRVQQAQPRLLPGRSEADQSPLARDRAGVEGFALGLFLHHSCCPQELGLVERSYLGSDLMRALAALPPPQAYESKRSLNQQSICTTFSEIHVN